jgi:leucine-rich repeat transmembrane neuronal protein 1/2
MHGLLFVAGTSGSFFSCEIVDGVLYFVYDFGAGAKRVRISSSFVNDGQPHSVRISFSNSRRVIVYCDSTPTTINLSGSETSLYFRGGIWFGGPRENSELSWYMISRNGFVGCLLDFILKDTSKY